MEFFVVFVVIISFLGIFELYLYIVLSLYKFFIIIIIIIIISYKTGVK